jgi:hypothetical protein
MALITVTTFQTKHALSSMIEAVHSTRASLNSTRNAIQLNNTTAALANLNTADLMLEQLNEILQVNSTMGAK